MNILLIWKQESGTVNIMKKYEEEFYKWLEKNDIEYTEFLTLQLNALYEEYLIEKETNKQSFIVRT